jgi:ABC-type sulfate/molybdate transport systems ATPase subunit
VSPPELVARFNHRVGDLQLQVDTRFLNGCTVLSGPSGAGKTSILKILVGLTTPDSGQLTFGDRAWCDTARRQFLSSAKRQLGYAPQAPSLFPHLTVSENVAFGASHSEPWLQLFGVAGWAKRYPRELSGGEQQLVSLLRALARQPNVLLLDEPFSSMGAALKLKAIEILKGHCDSRPVILISHSEEEATLLEAKRVACDHGLLKT